MNVQLSDAMDGITAAQQIYSEMDLPYYFILLTLAATTGLSILWLWKRPAMR